MPTFGQNWAEIYTYQEKSTKKHQKDQQNQQNEKNQQKTRVSFCHKYREAPQTRA